MFLPLRSRKKSDVNFVRGVACIFFITQIT